VPRDTLSFKRTRRSNKGMSQQKNKAKVRWFGTKKRHGSVHFPPSNLIPSCFMFLCVSSIHTTLEPSLTSTTSLRIPPPPQASLSPHTQLPNKLKKCGKAFDELFCPNFPLFLLVEGTFTIKPAKNLFYPLL
jgi:hypothetical protein